MSSKGSMMLVLHAHMPYINHPQSSQYLEENWFFEAVAETYIPLISVFERLVADGIRPGVTLSISPTLGAMLENELLEKKLGEYIDSRLKLLESELERTAGDPAFHRTVQLYQKLYSDAAEMLHKYSGDLITPLKALQHAGQIEIITSSATHSILPLLAHPEALRAQVAVAAEDYFDRFNRKPSGFWLPECAYNQSLNAYLKLSGFKYFFTEAHAVEFAGSPRNGVYSAYRTPNGVSLFSRDAQSSREVWSSKFGYPGAPEYREFYRDLGYDAQEQYLKPCLGSGGRRPIGLKYYKITGLNVPLNQKQPYDPEEAMAAVERHAEDFLGKRMAQIDGLYSSKGIRPVIVGCYDAELFGHWWFEGPAFLESILRRIRQDRLPFQFVTPSEYLNSCQEPLELSPQISSWGENGYFDPWLNETNDFIYPLTAAVTERMIDTANRFRNQDLSRPVERALNQAAREVLLSQSSDWAFLLYIGSHGSYAKGRLDSHAANARRLLSEVIEKRVDEPNLRELETQNNIFPRLDFRVFSSVPNF